MKKLSPRERPDQMRRQHFAQEVGEVRDSAALFNPQSNEPYTPQGPENLLMQLRASFPFVPIMPWARPVSKVLVAAGVAYDIEFPDATTLVMFSGNGDYYVCFDGAAAIPVAGAENGNCSVFRPEFSWFFTTHRTASLVSPNAGTIVQAMCYQPTKLPRY